MIKIDDDTLLMIEPACAASAEPLIDGLTRRMAGAWASRVDLPGGYRGCHDCTGERCEAASDNHDHEVSAGGGALLTHSLAVHYLAYHRDDVPDGELAKVAALVADEVEPSVELLRGTRSA